MIKLIQNYSAESLKGVRRLFKEYEDALGFKLSFQNFKKELSSLPGEYCPPKGCIILAMGNGRIVGCVAVRKISGETAEMKRLYVKPRHRGKGVGELLAKEAMGQAKLMGYKKMKLDTVSKMIPAIELYKKLGFKECKPYRFNPFDDAKFFRANLKYKKQA